MVIYLLKTLIVSISSSVKCKFSHSQVIFSGWLKFLNSCSIALPEDCSFLYCLSHCLLGDTDGIGWHSYSVSGKFISLMSMPWAVVSPIVLPTFYFGTHYLLKYDGFVASSDVEFLWTVAFFVILIYLSFAIHILLCVPLLHRKLLALISVMGLGGAEKSKPCISEHLKIVYKIPFE